MRGCKPTEIFSYYGRVFVVAEKELYSFFQNYSQQLIDYAVNDGIKLIFISPYAPHFGGMWEAGVKSCKYHLKQGLGNSNMTYEDFDAVLS